MNSFFARNRLSAYLDHSLPRDEAEAVAEAVARDIALSADLRAMKKALTLLQEQGRVPAPTGFQARTMAAVSQQPVPGSQVAWLQRRLRRIPTELIAVVGAAVIVLIGLSGRDTPAPTPSPAPPVAVARQCVRWHGPNFNAVSRGCLEATARGYRLIDYVKRERSDIHRVHTDLNCVCTDLNRVRLTHEQIEKIVPARMRWIVCLHKGSPLGREA